MSANIRLNALLISTYFFAVQGSPPIPAHSPEAHTDLICHTSHASECYPATFQPTEHFQPVRDDQSIPPGLHVRLNLATGLKEARLNVTEPENAPKADIVLIDNPPLAAVDDQAALMPDELSPEQPLPIAPTEEAEQIAYYRRYVSRIFPLHDITSQKDDILQALNALTELAHSFEWGHRIASVSRLTGALLYYFNPISASPIEVQSAAAHLLGAIIQNNPEASAALLNRCSDAISCIYPDLRPKDVVYDALRDSSGKELTVENTRLQRRLLFFLYQLSHDTGSDTSESKRRAYAYELPMLLAVFDPEALSLNDGRDKVRAWVADYLLELVLPALGAGLDPIMEGNPLHDYMDVESWRSAFRRIIKMYENAGTDSLLSHGSLEAYESIRLAYGTMNRLADAGSAPQAEL